jgi:23S rRNA (guanosine2251-2'-O)-methyltransferase
MEILYGLHPVEEALRSGSRQFDHVCVARDRSDQKLQRIIDTCRKNSIRLRLETREELTRMAKTSGHQGVVAVVRTREFLELEDLFEGAPGTAESVPRLLLALDGVEDPQNLGALLRTADAAAVDGVIVTERRAAPLSAVAVKASAGAAEHVRIARVVNLVRALEQLKEKNIWCVGLDERGTLGYDQYDFTSNTVVVLGREGDGLHDLVRKTCDHLLRIPMAGRVASLNVSAAGAVVLFEAARQRRGQNQPSPVLTPRPDKPVKERKGLGS